MQGKAAGCAATASGPVCCKRGLSAPANDHSHPDGIKGVPCHAQCCSCRMAVSQSVPLGALYWACVMPCTSACAAMSYFTCELTSVSRPLLLLGDV